MNIREGVISDGERQRFEGEGRAEGQGREVVRQLDGSALCRHVAEQYGRTCLLAFSAGKDAVCAWLQLRRHFDVVIPFYREVVPGLEFVETGLRYYEAWFKTPILRVPHPGTVRMLREMVFQPPERLTAIEAADFPPYSYLDSNREARAKLGDHWIGIGTRAADNPVRAMNIKRMGAANFKTREFQPVWDWKIADVEREIRSAGVGLTVDYEMFGRSFDGLAYEYLKPIRDRYPDDYAKILDWFPLADIELFRRGEL